MYCSQCGQQTEDSAIFCKNCGTRIAAEQKDVAIQTDKELAVMDHLPYHTILEFLQNAKSIEVQKFSIQQIISSIDTEIARLNYKKKIEKQETGCLFATAPLILFVAAIIGAIMAFFKGCGDIWHDNKYSHNIDYGRNYFSGFGDTVQTMLIVGAIIAGILLIIDFIKKSGAKAAYDEACKKEEAAYNYRQFCISQLRQQRTECLAHLQSLDDTLSNLYSLNIISEPYRSIVPIITICEYFEIGKCNSLKGRDGAYVLYDYEAMQKKIISKLDDIINRLDELIDLQRSMCQAIRESNALTMRIMDQNRELLSTGRDIAANTESAAYFSKCAQEYSRISAYVAAFG